MIAAGAAQWISFSRSATRDAPALLPPRQRQPCAPHAARGNRRALRTRVRRPGERRAQVAAVPEAEPERADPGARRRRLRPLRSGRHLPVPRRQVPRVETGAAAAYTRARAPLPVAFLVHQYAAGDADALLLRRAHGRRRRPAGRRAGEAARRSAHRPDARPSWRTAGAWRRLAAWPAVQRSRPVCADARALDPQLRAPRAQPAAPGAVPAADARAAGGAARVRDGEAGDALRVNGSLPESTWPNPAPASPTSGAPSAACTTAAASSSRTLGIRAARATCRASASRRSPPPARASRGRRRGPTTA